MRAGGVFAALSGCIAHVNGAGIAVVAALFPCCLTGLRAFGLLLFTGTTVTIATVAGVIGLADTSQRAWTALSDVGGIGGVGDIPRSIGGGFIVAR